MQLSLRSKRRDAEALEAEVARCDGQLRELDYDKVEAEKNEVSRAYMKHDSRKSRIGGELDQLAQAIRQNERQLAEGRLRDADRKYYEKKVELRCRQHVIGDLDKYYRALDWAIMQYHRYGSANQ